jgi:uncharacterized protein YjbI with pentapeptide repeats
MFVFTRSVRAVAVAVVVVLGLGLVDGTAASAAGCPSVAENGIVTPLPGPGSDLSGCDLSGASLAFVDLTYSTLLGTSLVGATLRAVDLKHSDLRGADLTGSMLDDSDLGYSDLSGAVLREARMSTGSFAYATLDDADLGGAVLTSVSLRGVSARRARLVDVELPYDQSASSILEDADLTDADLTGLRSNHASFVRADLSGADLTDALLWTASVSGALLGTATLSGVSSVALQGSPATLPPGWRVANQYLVGPGATLRGAALRNLDLHGADLTGADLHFAKLSSSDLRAATFDGADLTAAYFDGADLTGATLTGALTGSNVWTGATCMDGFSARAHLTGSCLRPRDTTPPVVALATVPAPGFVTSLQRFVPILASDPGGTGYEAFQLRRRSAPAGSTRFGSWAVDEFFVADTRALLAGAPGHRTCAQVRGRDVAGNVGAWSTETCFDTVFDDGSPSLTWSGRWVMRNGSSWFETSYSSTRHRGDTYRTLAAKDVRRVGLVATTCPSCGRIEVRVGKTFVGSISLSRRTTTARTLVLLPRASRLLHGRVRFEVVSSKKLVRLDGIALSVV